jgi:hypothetical protein
MHAFTTEFYTSIAQDLRQFISPEFDRFEVAAALTETARELAGGDPSHAHFHQALAKYLRQLPADHDEARSIIARDAAKALSLPGVLTDRQKIDAARLALAEAEAELEQAIHEQGRRVEDMQRLEKNIKEDTDSLNVWQLDFDAIEAAALETIDKLFALPPFLRSPNNTSKLNCAFEDLNRLPHLKKVRPIAEARLQERIARAKASLEKLRTHSPA